MCDSLASGSMPKVRTDQNAAVIILARTRRCRPAGATITW